MPTGDKPAGGRARIISCAAYCRRRTRRCGVVMIDKSNTGRKEDSSECGADMDSLPSAHLRTIRQWPVPVG
jgi:hypothetical protein